MSTTKGSDSKPAASDSPPVRKSPRGPPGSVTMTSKGEGSRSGSPATRQSTMTTRSKADPEMGLRRRAAIAAMATSPGDAGASTRRNSMGSNSLQRSNSQPQGEKGDKQKLKSSSTSNLNSVTAAASKESSKGSGDSSGKNRNEGGGTGSRKRQATESPGDQSNGPGPNKKHKTIRLNIEEGSRETDCFCWICHAEGTVVCCELCPRVYHLRCLALEKQPVGEWVCPECEKQMRAECVETRSKAMSMITVDHLCVLLKYAVGRMKCQGSELFQHPVDPQTVPSYRDYVFNPMDLNTLEKNVRRKHYGCTEAFLADAKWILHNCIIFNGQYHRLTATAKLIIKISKHEMSEIEVCPDCYTSSVHKKNDNWFCEPCRSPHPLVWAKLKGYPFWPAKALREANGLVDVRFFGEHDRSWVPVSQIFMLSKEPPSTIRNTRGAFENSMKELALHIDRIREKFGSFEYAALKTPYDKNDTYDARKVKFKPMKPPMLKKMKLVAMEAGETVQASPTKSDDPQVKGQLSVQPKQETRGGEQKSVVRKTASAVKNKYNSIITTRRAAGIKVPSKIKPCLLKKKPAAPSGVFTITDAALDSEARNIELSNRGCIDPKTLPVPKVDILKKLEVTIGQMEDDEEPKDEATEAGEGEAQAEPDKMQIDNADETMETAKSDSQMSEPEKTKADDADHPSDDKEDDKEDAAKDGQEATSQDQSDSDKGDVNEKSSVESDDAKPADTTDPQESGSNPEMVDKDSKDDTKSEKADEEKEAGEATEAPGENGAEEVKVVSSDPSPSKPKNAFLENLVASCKAKLGISEDKLDEQLVEKAGSENGGSEDETTDMSGEETEKHTESQESDKQKVSGKDSEVDSTKCDEKSTMALSDKTEEGDNQTQPASTEDAEQNRQSEEEAKTADSSDKESQALTEENSEKDSEKTPDGRVESQTTSADITKKSATECSEKEGEVSSVLESQEKETAEKMVTETSSGDTEKQSKEVTTNSASNQDVDVLKSEKVDSSDNMVKDETETETMDSRDDVVQGEAEEKMDTSENLSKNETEASVSSGVKEKTDSQPNQSLSVNNKDSSVVKDSQAESASIDKMDVSDDDEGNALVIDLGDGSSRNKDKGESKASSVEGHKSLEVESQTKEESLSKVKVKDNDEIKSKPDVEILDSNGESLSQKTSSNTEGLSAVTGSCTQSLSTVTGSCTQTSPTGASHTTRPSSVLSTSSSDSAKSAVHPSVLPAHPPRSHSSPATQSKADSPGISSAQTVPAAHGGESSIRRKSTEWKEKQLQMRRAQYDEDQKKRQSVSSSHPGEPLVIQPDGPLSGSGKTTASPYSLPHLHQSVPANQMRHSPGGGSSQVSPTDAASDNVDSALIEIVKLNQDTFERYRGKLVDSLKGTFEAMYEDILKGQPYMAITRHFQQQLEKIKWQHMNEINEIKHNAALNINELKAAFEAEKQLAVKEAKKQAEDDKQKAINETKKKQWCAQCGKEAIFYCCWNTSYCDYPCQQAHWPTHMASCTQAQGGGQGQDQPQTTSSPISQSQQQSQSSPATSKPVSDWKDRSRDHLNAVLRQQEVERQQRVQQQSLAYIPQGIAPVVSMATQLGGQVRQTSSMMQTTPAQLQYMPQGGAAAYPTVQQQMPLASLQNMPIGGTRPPLQKTPQGTPPRPNLMYHLQVPPQMNHPTLHILPQGDQRPPPVQMVRGPIPPQFVPRSY